MEKNTHFEYIIVVTLVVVVAILSLVFMTQLQYMKSNQPTGTTGYLIDGGQDIPVVPIRYPHHKTSASTTTDDSNSTTDSTSSLEIK